jgi:iron complex outermembrane recepter protein
MSKTKVLTGKLRLHCGASLLAIAVALGSAGVASADEATKVVVDKAAKSKGETQVAQNTPAPPPPPAPPASSQPVEKVTVTGFRGALRSALEKKRNSSTQIDAIKAEDIAKFPDLNLSEAIQRIPGVAISRDAGEGRNITVRGLGPQFTRIRINGLEALATAGGTDAAGGTNRNRLFDFNVFAADLFNDITVRKTAAAEVEEGSLGATVDLSTPHPLDYDKFVMAASAQYGYNDLSDSYDPRAAFLISDTFGDGQFGVLFSVAYSRRELLEEGASTVRWQNGGTCPAAAPATFPFPAANTNCFGSLEPGYVGPSYAAINAAFRPRIPRYDIYEHEQERLGMTGSLQWRPSDRTTFTLDGLYSKFEGTRAEIFLEVPVFSTAGSSTSALPANANINDVNPVQAAIEGNSLVFGVFNDVDIRSEARFDELSTTFKQLTFDADHEFSDRFAVHGLLGWAESDHQNPVQTTLLFDAFNVDGFTYDFRGNNRLPLINYGATDVTSPATWTLSQIRLRPQSAVNSFHGAIGSWDYHAMDWLTMKGGLEWKKYEFETTELRRVGANPTANFETNIPTIPGTTPISNYSKLVALTGSGLNIPAGTTSVWLIPDIDKAAALWNLYDTTVFPMGTGPAAGNNASITEQNTGGYLQADFEFPEMRLRGNLGVRYVETEQSAKALATGGNQIRTVTSEREYSDTLPSLNLVAEPIEDFLVRFGVAKVMSRPGLGNISPGVVVSVSGNNRTITAGNSDLDPFRADTADIAFEWYFQPQGIISVAGFWKDIGSFVQTIREDLPNFAANPFGLDDNVATAACGTTAGCSPTATWQLLLPTNTPGGELTGFEINYQQPLTFLPAPLDNFGVLLNYTYVQTEIVYVNSTGGTVAIDDLTNLSRRAYNATLYYEDDVFSARVSAAYRGNYPTTIPGRNGNTLEATAETFNVDAAVSYALTDHIKISLEGINLTDEANDQFLTPDNRLSFYHHFGRQYFLGVRYTY